MSGGGRRGGRGAGAAGSKGSRRRQPGRGGASGSQGSRSGAAGSKGSRRRQQQPGGSRGGRRSREGASGAGAPAAVSASEALRRRIVEKINSEYESSQHAFKEFDRLGTKVLTKDTFRFGLSRIGFDITETEVMNLIAPFDLDGDGCIDEAEWYRFINGLPATMAGKKPTAEPSAEDAKRYEELRKRVIKRVNEEFGGAIHFRKAFTFFDVRKVGKLDVGELLVGLRKLDLDLTEEELAHVFLPYDSDGDGKINSQELYSFLQNLPPPNKPGKVSYKAEAEKDPVQAKRKQLLDLLHSKFADFQQGFAFFNEAKTGNISFDTMRRGFAKLGFDITEREAYQLLQPYDKDGDGHINSREFYLMYNSYKAT